MGRVPRRNVALVSLTTLALAALAAIVVVRIAASHGPSAKALPSDLAAVARHLASADDIHLRPLPAGATPQVGQAAAEAAVRRFSGGAPLPGKLSAFAVLETDRTLAQRQSDGTFRLEISNRPVWVVVFPKKRVQGFVETTVFTVDAMTGKVYDGVSS